MRSWVAPLVPVVLLIPPALAGCGRDDGTTLRVLAASSLQAPFAEVEEAFEEQHGDVDVEVVHGGSSSLSAQVDAGAPADVLVTADETTMAATTQVRRPATPIARNALVIAVEVGNPAGIDALADLARDGLVVVLCAAEVPCGRYAARALDRAGVELEPASREENVKAVVAKIALGEADAGIVYATDVEPGGPIEGVAFAGADDPELTTTYLAAVTTASDQPDLAAELVAFLTGAEGRSILADHGFLTR